VTYDVVNQWESFSESTRRLSISATIAMGHIPSPRPHHFNKGTNGDLLGHNVCPAAICVRHNNDRPAEFEETLKRLEEMAPGLVVPSNTVDLEVPKIGRIYLDAGVRPLCLLRREGSESALELTEWRSHSQPACGSTRLKSDIIEN
jgi:hypothetical protein